MFTSDYHDIIALVIERSTRLFLIMERLFEENGFPGLHVTDTAIEVVIRMLCHSTDELEQLINRYNLDRSHRVIDRILSEFHGIDMAAYGFETVPMRQRTPQAATTEPEITCSNRFNALEDITLEEMSDFLEVYALSSQGLEDFVMDSDLLQVRGTTIYKYI